MQEIMRCLHERGPANPGIAVDAEGVMLGPDCVLVRRTPRGYRCIDDEEAAALQACLFGDHRDSDWLFGRCRRIAKALDDGDVPLAQIFGIYIGIGALGAEQLKRLSLTAPLIKANFDPGEARIPAGQPGGGQWTMGGGGKAPSIANTMEIDADRINVASQGGYHEAVAADLADTPVNDAPPDENDSGLHLTSSNDPFHDAVEDYLVRAFTESGSIVEQQVRITSIGTGVTAIPDILGMTPNGFVFAVDVKTGLNPGLTPPQQFVYALMDIGHHVYSSDPRVRSFGFTPGQLLPPICVYYFYARVPGSPIEVKTFSTNPDCLPLQGGALAKAAGGLVGSQEVAAMSDPATGAQYVQQVLLGDIVKDGKTAIALVEVLMRSLYSDSTLEEQQPFAARDGGRVWIVEGSLNKDRSVEGPGKLNATVNKLDAKIGAFMFDYVIFPPTEPPSSK